MGLAERIENIVNETPILRKAFGEQSTGTEPPKKSLDDLDKALPKPVVQSIAAVLSGIAGVAVFAGKRSRTQATRIRKAVVGGTATGIELARRFSDDIDAAQRARFSGGSTFVSGRSGQPRSGPIPRSKATASLGEPVIEIFDDPTPDRDSSPFFFDPVAARMVRARASASGGCNCSAPASSMSPRCREICGK